MMKFVVINFILVILFLSGYLAFNAENYSTYIEELSHDEKFLDEYTKWSSQLFSQSDYLYGSHHEKFPCSIENSTDNNTIPTSVHSLRPSDIKCIGAIGDSLITGLSAHAITPIGLLSENRGLSWSVGGDYTYSKIISLPNILRQYNPKLEGFSTQISEMFPNGQNASHNRLNVGKSGDHFVDMPYQAELLLDRLRTEKSCDWNNDWKLITISIGTNDLCHFCEDSKHTAEEYLTSVRDTLDTLYNASLPRTFVNLVFTPDIRYVKDLNRGGYVCQTLLKKICPCAASPTDNQTKILHHYIIQYHKVLVDLLKSERYNQRDDFTVVIQPLMVHFKFLYKDDKTIDHSYFAPDCFHLSGKGHSQAAISLWNNMLQPVNGKQATWTTDQSLKCPTKEFPYIFTSKNSAEALEKSKITTTTQTTNVPTTTSQVFITNTNTTSEMNVTTTAQRHSKHHKDKKSKSDSSFSKMKLLAVTGFVLFIALILIVGILRRQKARSLLNLPNKHNGFDVIHNSPSIDDIDIDDDELWSQPKSTYADTTKTHGTRVSFD